MVTNIPCELLFIDLIVSLGISQNLSWMGGGGEIKIFRTKIRDPP